MSPDGYGCRIHSPYGITESYGTADRHIATINILYSFSGMCINADSRRSAAYSLVTATDSYGRIFAGRIPETESNTTVSGRSCNIILAANSNGIFINTLVMITRRKTVRFNIDSTITVIVTCQSLLRC